MGYQEALPAHEQAATFDCMTSAAGYNTRFALYDLMRYQEALAAAWNNNARGGALERTAEAEHAKRRAKELSG